MTPYGKLPTEIPALLYVGGGCYDVAIVRRRRGRVEVRNMTAETLRVPGPQLMHTVAPGATVTVPESSVEVQHGR